MTNGKVLCLSMIVKNEMMNLERCLVSIADHVGCWVIGDIGSSDDTADFIRSFFAARNLPGELHSFPLLDVEQAQSETLACAKASSLPYDYLLFADPNIELIVEDPGFRAKLNASGYRLIKWNESGLFTWNAVLVQRRAGGCYRGVTCGYLEVPGGVRPLHGVCYRDHTSGSQRIDKFARDSRLLIHALKQEPDNARYWFYLAQSCCDAGGLTEAAQAYAKRAEMGGRDQEEAWYARLQEARCLRKLGDEGGFLRQALAAFNQRPRRAEPLYDLARFYREKGMNDASVLFSEAGLAIPRPEQEILFLEDFVYTMGLQEEYSISANYSRDAARKERGHQACNFLSLKREIRVDSRNLARSNLRFYALPASLMMPSFTARPIGFEPPGGYRPTNPSVARWGEEIVIVQRAVKYTLTPDGGYHKLEVDPSLPRNYLLRLDAKLNIMHSAPILPPVGLPKPEFAEEGPLDLRLFVWHDALWCIGHIVELTQGQRWVNQILARIDSSIPNSCRLVDWRMLIPQGPRLLEKNWMPQIIGDNLRFIYLCDPTRMLDDEARLVSETVPSIAAEDFRGGTQAIAFDGGWLALIHQVAFRNARARLYFHRFVWLDKTNVLRRLSRQFFFRDKGVEFAAGLAWHPDGRRLLISYGTQDAESCIASVAAEDVGRLLEHTQNLPCG